MPKEGAVGMSVGRAVALGMLAAWCGGGCRTDVDGPSVLVSDSAGIPVFELSRLPAWDDPDWMWSMELVREVATGSARPDEAPVLFDPQAFTRMPDGTLVVVDSWETRLAVIPADRDEVVARFGPTGQGPGEMWAGIQLWPASEDEFWAMDMGNQRLSRWTLDGEVVSERRVEITGMGAMPMQEPGTHLPYTWKWFQDPATGELRDSVAALNVEAGRMVNFTALPPRVRPNAGGPIAYVTDAQAWYAPVGGGAVVVGLNDGGPITHVGPDSRVLGVIRIPMERREITEADRLRITEEWRSMEGGRYANLPVEFGDRARAWSNMWPLAESLFVLAQTRNTTNAGEPLIPSGQWVWRVFSVQGDYRGAIVWPPGFALPFWREDGHVTGVLRDDLGLATIQTYRISPPGTPADPAS